MALTIARTESQLSATTAFQAMDNLMASTVSSSFVVPANVSKLVSIEIATTSDASEDFNVISGNSIECGIAVTDAATISATVVMTFA